MEGNYSMRMHLRSRMPDSPVRAHAAIAGRAVDPPRTLMHIFFPLPLPPFLAAVDPNGASTAGAPLRSSRVRSSSVHPTTAAAGEGRKEGEVVRPLGFRGADCPLHLCDGLWRLE